MEGEKGERYQLVLRLDGDDVVAVLTHVLAELDILAGQAVGACGVARVLVHQARGGGLLAHHLLQHQADVVSQDAEHTVQMHAVLRGIFVMSGMAGCAMVVTAAHERDNGDYWDDLQAWR